MLQSTAELALNKESVVYRNPSQEFSTLDGEIVMLCYDSGAYLSLNDTASRIWELCAERTSIAEVSMQINNEYDIDYSTAESEVIQCLNELKDKGLILADE